MVKYFRIAFGVKLEILFVFSQNRRQNIMNYWLLALEITSRSYRRRVNVLRDKIVGVFQELPARGIYLLINQGLRDVSD